ncbi:helix-turn-helix domain-containing protein [Secundilactobacillus yichangensis]|uniref:helix-turn-helix domain-containing protein n=1 Tax=Secundilactobacillus yichangensis TaxID=2799580 RepID=UPI0019449A62|nr:helix-turn-helix transcriptional regulator [Secundilactobacillus yichangensis]
MNRLKKVREQNGASLRAVAAVIGTSNQNLSNWERDSREGYPKLPVDTWKLLADFFGVSVPYLQGISDEPTPISDVALEITKHIMKVIKDPRNLDERERLNLDSFLYTLQSLGSFAKASELLSNIITKLDALTDFDHLEDGKSVNQSELVDQFKQLLEQINQIRDDQNN